jgi:pimeloyl-ACP methyl ester carboxylesterase
MGRTYEAMPPSADGTPPDAPPALPAIEAPSNLQFAGEAMAPLELARLIRAARRLGGAPRGGGRRLLVLPGFGANDASTLPLRTYLRGVGFRPSGWGLGLNRGQVAEKMPALLELTERAAEEGGGRVALVGWSMGGVLSREIARERPELLNRVITFGTPVVGGPRYTRTARAYAEQALVQIARDVEERNRDVPIEVPITAIHSKRDGIVAWRACVDDFSPNVENIEVRSTHVGMGIDPDVWAILTDRLTRDPEPA